VTIEIGGYAVRQKSSGSHPCDIDLQTESDLITSSKKQGSVSPWDADSESGGRQGANDPKSAMLYDRFATCSEFVSYVFSDTTLALLLLDYFSEPDSRMRRVKRSAAQLWTGGSLGPVT
jgi:hypothetical protein